VDSGRNGLVGAETQGEAVVAVAVLAHADQGAQPTPQPRELPSWRSTVADLVEREPEGPVTVTTADGTSNTATLTIGPG